MKYEDKLKSLELNIKDGEKNKEDILKLFDTVSKDKRLNNNNKSVLLFKIKKLYKLLA